MKKQLGIYIHFPFCARKCKYCDFLSFCDGEASYPAYIDAVKREIAGWGKGYGESNRQVEVSTIYMGGGTPSLLPVLYIEEIMETLHHYFQISENCEVTLECNPGTVDEKKLQRYREMGINRLSFGLQSTEDKELQVLGRIHTYEEFVQCYRDARRVGFKNINVDVMSALPGQNLNSYRRTLERVIALEPEHISSYSLIIEEGTPFYEMWEKDELDLPDEDTEREMYYDTERYLNQAGYRRYEISNYAKPGYESRHNSSYWLRKDYLGIGLGAASMVDNVRFHNSEKMDVYLQQNMAIMSVEKIAQRYEDVEILTERQQMEEYMFLGLRMTGGVSLQDFEKTFGVTLESVYGETCRKLESQKLLCREDDILRLSKKGIDVSNVVLAEFI